MKKSIFKILSIASLTLTISLTSCNKKNKIVIETETKPATDLKITTPQPSPLGKISQRVGLTDIDIAYSRPGVKGRTIFGELLLSEKYGELGQIQIRKLPLVLM